MCVFITTGPSTKRTSERGGEGDCVREGGGGEGKFERERAGIQLGQFVRGFILLVIFHEF